MTLVPPLCWPSINADGVKLYQSIIIIIVEIDQTCVGSRDRRPPSAHRPITAGQAL